MLVDSFFVVDVSTRLRVLIADDIEETRRNTRVMLAMNPEVDVVAIAKDGEQAIEMANELNPDIAILDIYMPGVDGLAAYEVMKEKNPHIACIIMSGEKDTQILRRAMSVGAREYLIKPFTVDELNLAVHNVGLRIRQKSQESPKSGKAHEQSEDYLKQLAVELTKSRRTDSKALRVFELLASNPKCELRWLRTLAMIYVVRKDWEKLKVLAERLVAQETGSGADL